MGGGRGAGGLVAVPWVGFSEGAGTGRIRKDATASLCPEARVQVTLNGLRKVWPPPEVSRLKWTVSPVARTSPSPGRLKVIEGRVPEPETDRGPEPVATSVRGTVNGTLSLAGPCGESTSPVTTPVPSAH